MRRFLVTGAVLAITSLVLGQTASSPSGAQDESRPAVAQAEQCPSRRFTPEELDFARAVAAGPRGLDREILSVAAGRLQLDPPSPGWAELAFRFDWANRKPDVLAKLRDRPPTQADLEAIRVCLCDPDGPLRQAAARILRDGGATPLDVLLVERVRARGPPPERCLETLGPEETIRFAAAGHESAIEELVHHEWTADSVRALWDWGRPLRRLRDPRIVRIHVDALLAARRGFPRAECDLTSYDVVATITNWLRELPRADQDVALGWLDGAPPFLEDRRWSQLLQVRAALGEPPTPGLMATLENTGVADTCELSLVPWADRYAELLPALRADPRKYWFQLALLRDATAAGELAKWLDEVVADPKKIAVVRDVVLALRLIGGKAALEALYRAAKPALRARNPKAAGVILHAIVRIESPDQWKRVAALAEPAPDRFNLANLAAVELLAKKP